MRGELDAAEITDPAMRAAYARCRALNAQHGKTFFQATRLLAPAQRPAIHALYGFARITDDLVDEPGIEGGGLAPSVRLDQLERALPAALRGEPGCEALLAAVADTAARFGIPESLFYAFLRSMRMDLSTTDYPTRAALDEYMYGSAQVIGLQVLPVLGTVAGRKEAAAPYAAALGKAFQLTNFLRDVAEDLDRGRVYLPADELAAFGVDRDRLAWCAGRGYPDHAVRRALADQVATTRAVYRYAYQGIGLLHPVSRPCVVTAYTLYSGILDRVEALGHNVFRHRARVSRSRRLVIGGCAWARARLARMVHHPVHSTASGL